MSQQTGLNKFGANGDWRKRGEKDNSPTLRLIFDALDEEFAFNFDPCPLNVEGMRDFDGFGGDWGTRTYVNPPWSKCAAWVEEALRQFRQGKLIVMFMPANISSLWFCEKVIGNAKEVRIVRGKLTPASTIVIVFDPSVPSPSFPKFSVFNPVKEKAPPASNSESASPAPSPEGVEAT